MKKLIIIWASLGIFSLLPTKSLAQIDSSHVLSITEFLKIVQEYHPIAKQASLITKQANEELNFAKGGWDPQLNSNYDQKKFESKNYYSYFENNLKIPTWYGVDIKAGYDYTTGVNLNSESKLPNDGLAYLGISIPLAKNMIMDKRRATLAQAKLFIEASEQQKKIIINDLILEAKYTFYEWYYTYNELLIYKNALKIAEDRFEATKLLVEYGDRPSIDTIEALTQLQSRQLQLNDAQNNFVLKSLELNNYLWLENNVNYPIDTLMYPNLGSMALDSNLIELKSLEEMESELSKNHPLLINYTYKIKQLEIERKLKVENLKPNLNVNYNLISGGPNFSDYSNYEFKNNYKLGFNFSLPLTFMQGRAEVKLAKIKIKDTEYQQSLKNRELVNKVRSYYNQLLNLKKQTTLFEQTIANYKLLLEGEENRFQNGESSIFLVNTRENKLIESQLKLTELNTKFLKTEASLKWSIGVF
jgi:outer membrane protein TolC